MSGKRIATARAVQTPDVWERGAGAVDVAVRNYAIHSAKYIKRKGGASLRRPKSETVYYFAEVPLYGHRVLEPVVE